MYKNHFLATSTSANYFVHSLKNKRYIEKLLPDIANKGNTISFKYNSADFLASASLLEVDLLCLVEDGVHVFIEADDFSFNAQVSILVEPDLHAWLSLEEFVDQELYLEKCVLNKLSCLLLAWSLASEAFSADFSPLCYLFI